MRTDLAFLISKVGKLYTFPYIISHVEFLEKILFLQNEQLEYYIDRNVIVGEVSNRYIEIRVRTNAKPAIETLYKFLCNKDYFNKKIYLVVGEEKIAGYNFCGYSLNEVLLKLDRLCRK